MHINTFFPILLVSIAVLAAANFYVEPSLAQDFLPSPFLPLIGKQRDRRQIKSMPSSELWVVPQESSNRQFKRRYFDSLAGQSLGKRSFYARSPFWNGVDPAVSTDIDPTEFLRQHLKYLMNRRL